MSAKKYLYKAGKIFTFSCLTQVSMSVLAGQQLVSDYDKNLCLTATDNQIGAPIKALGCSSDTNQVWLTKGHQIQLVSTPELCITAGSLSSYAELNLQRCESSPGLQYFNYYNNVLTTSNGHAIDLVRGTGQVIIWHHAHGYDNQRWLSKEVALQDRAIPQINNDHSGFTLSSGYDNNLCLIPSAATNGAQIKALSCNSADSLWLQAGDQLQLKSRPELCLEADNLWYNATLKLKQCDNNQQLQKWQYDTDKELLLSLGTSFAIDLVRNTDQVVLWWMHGYDNQVWQREYDTSGTEVATTTQVAEVKQMTVIFSGNTVDLRSLKKGDKVALPASLDMQSKALKLLHHLNLITLADSGKREVTIDDILSNPLDLEFYILPQHQLGNALSLVNMVVIDKAYATSYGYTPADIAPLTQGELAVMAKEEAESNLPAQQEITPEDKIKEKAYGIIESAVEFGTDIATAVESKDAQSIGEAANSGIETIFGIVDIATPETLKKDDEIKKEAKNLVSNSVDFGTNIATAVASKDAKSIGEAANSGIDTIFNIVDLATPETLTKDDEIKKEFKNVASKGETFGQNVANAVKSKDPDSISQAAKSGLDVAFSLVNLFKSFF